MRGLYFHSEEKKGKEPISQTKTQVFPANVEMSRIPAQVWVGGSSNSQRSRNLDCQVHRRNPRGEIKKTATWRYEPWNEHVIFPSVAHLQHELLPQMSDSL